MKKLSVTYKADSYSDEEEVVISFDGVKIKAEYCLEFNEISFKKRPSIYGKVSKFFKDLALANIHKKSDTDDRIFLLGNYLVSIRIELLSALYGREIFHANSDILLSFDKDAEINSHWGDINESFALYPYETCIAAHKFFKKVRSYMLKNKAKFKKMHEENMAYVWGHTD